MNLIRKFLTTAALTFVLALGLMTHKSWAEGDGKDSDGENSIMMQMARQLEKPMFNFNPDETFKLSVEERQQIPKIGISTLSEMTLAEGANRKCLLPSDPAIELHIPARRYYASPTWIVVIKDQMAYVMYKEPESLREKFHEVVRQQPDFAKDSEKAHARTYALLNAEANRGFCFNSNYKGHHSPAYILSMAARLTENEFKNGIRGVVTAMNNNLDHILGQLNISSENYNTSLFDPNRKFYAQDYINLVGAFYQSLGMDMSWQYTLGEYLKKVELGPLSTVTREPISFARWPEMAEFASTLELNNNTSELERILGLERMRKIYNESLIYSKASPQYKQLQLQFLATMTEDVKRVFTTDIYGVSYYRVYYVSIINTEDGKANKLLNEVRSMAVHFGVKWQ